MLTYSLRGGWNCTTHSSSPQKISLTLHISSQVGHLWSKLTLTCSQPPLQEAMMAICSFRYLFSAKKQAMPSNPCLTTWIRLSCRMSAIFLISVSPFILSNNDFIFPIGVQDMQSISTTDLWFRSRIYTPSSFLFRILSFQLQAASKIVFLISLQFSHIATPFCTTCPG